MASTPSFPHILEVPSETCPRLKSIEDDIVLAHHKKHATI